MNTLTRMLLVGTGILMLAACPSPSQPAKTPAKSVPAPKTGPIIPDVPKPLKTTPQVTPSPTSFQASSSRWHRVRPMDLAPLRLQHTTPRYNPLDNTLEFYRALAE